MNDKDISEYLTALANTYEALQGPSLRVVICGGAALLAIGLIDRATKDIDLLGPPQLPPEFWEAAQTTADYYQLPKNWINLGPSSLWNSGLPIGYEKRLIPLTLPHAATLLRYSLISRFDQIHLKLYAAVDQGPSRHVQDLMRLQPTEEELLSAARWCLTQDVSEAFRGVLLDMLHQQGWDNVAEKLD